MKAHVVRDTQDKIIGIFRNYADAADSIQCNYSACRMLAGTVNYVLMECRGGKQFSITTYDYFEQVALI